MRDSFINLLTRLAMADDRIMLLTADLGFKVFDEYIETLPRQFLNVGVAEQNMTSVAAGMALEGHIVFTYSIGLFPTIRCLEQILVDVCYHNLNVKIVSVGGGFSYGPLGPTHHSLIDMACLRALPGMTVVVPGDAWEVEQAATAITYRDGPAYLRLDKTLPEPSHDPDERFVLGRARRCRDGEAATLVASGGILGEVRAAADQLERDGLRCRVLSMHTLVPLDTDELEAASRETGGIITIEEHYVSGGLGGAVAEVCLESRFRPGFFYRIGVRGSAPAVVGSQEFLRRRCEMNRDAIANTVRQQIRVSNGLDSAGALRPLSSLV
ncbi:MAG: transketolase C-terminal domain-containing protein [Rhodospirillaceae bacterium]